MDMLEKIGGKYEFVLTSYFNQWLFTIVSFETIREADPDSALTMTALRRLVVSGKLPSVRAGSKYLLNLDTLQEYLQNPGKFEKPAQEQKGVIRRIG